MWKSPRLSVSDTVQMLLSRPLVCSRPGTHMTSQCRTTEQHIHQATCVCVCVCDGAPHLHPTHWSPLLKPFPVLRPCSASQRRSGPKRCKHPDGLAGKPSKQTHSDPLKAVVLNRFQATDRDNGAKIFLFILRFLLTVGDEVYLHPQ